MPRTVLVAGYAALLVLLSGIVAVVARRSETLGVSHGGEDFVEECVNEGCESEEVRELYELYREECIEENCSKEEIIELGGNPASALSMFNDFASRGWAVNERDRLNLVCAPAGAEAQCALVFQLCKDSWQCNDGLHQSSWYVCGGCLFVSSASTVKDVK